MKMLVAISLLVVISCLSVRAFLTSSFVPTHDAEYHVVRLWQFDKNIRDGNFVPVWAPDLNQGYGVPIFAFFYPLPNYIGELFHLMGFSFIDSVKLVLATSMIVSSVFFFMWLRCFFTAFASFVGAVSFILAPYHLVVVNIRGSVGEAWALVFIPLALFLITKIIHSKRTYFIPIAGLSFSLSCLLLSHNVLGSIFFAFTIVYSTFLLFFENKKKIKPLLFGYILSIVSVSFFFIPLIFEGKYVTGLDIVNFRDHFVAFFQLIFPSWGSGFSVPGISDQLSFQIGIVHILALLISLYIAIKARNKFVIFLSVICYTTIFLMLDNSLFIWNFFAFLRFIQFPWRLLSIVVVLTSLMVGYVAMNKPKIGLTLLILCAMYIPYTNTVRYLPREDSFFLTNDNWTQGTTTVGNSFNTLWFSGPPTMDDREFMPTASDANVSDVIRTSTYSRAIIDSKETSFEIHRAYFPGWKAYSDAQEVSLTQNSHGIIKIDLPPGKHSIMIMFEGSPIRSISLWISTVTMVAIVYYSVYSLYENRHKHIST